LLDWHFPIAGALQGRKTFSHNRDPIAGLARKEEGKNRKMGKIRFFVSLGLPIHDSYIMKHSGIAKSTNLAHENHPYRLPYKKTDFSAKG
jgi:hypothetical protein